MKPLGSQDNYVGGILLTSRILRVAKGDVMLKNTHGVVLHLKSPGSEGCARDLGIEGVDVPLEK